jgi:hypothetical protein
MALLDPGNAAQLADHIGEIVAAVAALGTAAYGLVDVSKAVNGGVSRIGKETILTALAPFDAALTAAVGEGWRDIVVWHWINGVPKDDQKAKAKSLIRLGLSPRNAAAVAAAGHVEPAALEAAVTRLVDGDDMSTTDINVLGRFDASIDAILDSAYEHADQKYRNASRAWAAVVAWGLATIGGAVVFSGDQYTFGTFVMTSIIGFVSVPLAPIAKDVASSLTSAIGAIGAVTGKKS